MKAQGQNVVGVMVTPSSSNFTSATYEFGASGRRLNPGELLLLGLPVHLTKKTVDSVSLFHRRIEPATLG